MVGVVSDVRDEDDGDYHVNVLPDLKYEALLNAGNREDQEGALVTEIMPGQTLPIPEPGDRVAILGTWVFDSQHGWNEIHPIWAIRNLDAGRTVVSLPPSKPEHSVDEEGSGLVPPLAPGGSCDSSYPRVCIPPAPPDLDCADVPFHAFKVVPPDPHGFDGNHDGIGCQ